MKTLAEIEEAVTQLSPEDLEKFRIWFAEFEAEKWDNQFEHDVKTGRLDFLAQKALNDFQSGLCSDL